MRERRAYTPEDVADYEMTPEEQERFDTMRGLSRYIDTGFTPWAERKTKPRLVTVPIPDVPVEVLKDNLFKRPDKRIANKTYVIRSGSFVKIGIAVDVEQRFRNLMTANPHDMECLVVLPGGRTLERSLHLRFIEYRHRDEWFRIEGKLAEWIDAGFPDGT